jgi:cell division protein FtsW (lipid II flippase)
MLRNRFKTGRIFNTDDIELRLLLLAAGFLFLSSIALTLAPAVRAHGWSVSYRWSHWIGLSCWVVVFSLAAWQARRKLPGRDPYLLPITALLTGWGLLAVYRLSFHFGLRQTIWLALGIAMLIGVLQARDPLAMLKRFKYLWLSVGLLLIGLTFLLGVYPGGSGPTLWIGLGGIYLQPSEPLKLLIIIFLSAYLADRLPRQFSLKQTLAPLGLAFITALALLIGQRDLGTTSLIIILFAIILYYATDRLRVLVISGLLLVTGAGLGYLFFDVVRLRVDAWLNPWLDPSGRSYQVVQSLIAVASGGIFGSGIGLGSPGLIPVSQSDFIFAAICEEGGLFGALALLLVFCLLIQRGFKLALRSDDLFKRYLAGGISAYLALQTILIVAGNIRMLPITGVTLPFISYGGSSLITSLLSVGILMQLAADETNARQAARLASRPLTVTAGLLFSSFILLLLGCGWWTVIRSEALTSRTDNPRRTINDRFVLRGRILDRNDAVISETVGVSGSYTRQALVPRLSPVVGYTSPAYGQAGLEAALDDYLRGIRGYPALQQALNNLLYNQPPQGLDVRVSLSLVLQQRADELLGDQTGAVVLLNPLTGEILALASHPAYDANLLETSIEALRADEHAPLVNRTAQALYPAGTSLNTFLLADSLKGVLPVAPSHASAWLDGAVFPCALATGPDAGWKMLVTNGCPGSSLRLSSKFTSTSLPAFLGKLGFFSKPEVALDASFNELPDASVQFNHLALGMQGVDVSPLQLALAAAAISAEGIMPAPRLALSVNTPTEGWVILPVESETRQVFTTSQANDTADLLKVESQPYWQALGIAPLTPERTILWYLGGTLPGWNGTPAVVVVLLESNLPYRAELIGQSLILAAQ